MSKKIHKCGISNPHWTRKLKDYGLSPKRKPEPDRAAYNDHVND